MSTLKSCFFGFQNFDVSHREKNTFSSTLKFTILQMVRNECVKFGRHVDRQINYKILQLKVSNKPQILHNPPFFW